MSPGSRVKDKLSTAIIQVLDETLLVGEAEKTALEACLSKMSKEELTQLGRELDEKYKHADISKNIAGGYYDTLVEQGVIQKKGPLKVDNSSKNSKKIRKTSDSTQDALEPFFNWEELQRKNNFLLKKRAVLEELQTWLVKLMQTQIEAEVTYQNLAQKKNNSNDFSRQEIFSSLFAVIYKDGYSMLKTMLPVESITACALMKNHQGINALMFASSHARVDVAEDFLSLDSGDDQAIAVNDLQENALMNAVASGCVPIVKLLVGLESANIQAAATNFAGENALIKAVRNQSVDMVKLLLSLESAHQQATVRCFDGKNAMDYALELKNKAIVKLLEKLQ